MSALPRLVYTLLLITAFLFPCASVAEESANIPILCYHNFNEVRPGSMNLTPKKLEAQIKWIQDNGYTIVPLKEVVAYLQGKRASLPAKAVVITVDDGWKSAYTYLLPLAKKYNIPVTLFIYPQTISSGQNAMNWEELKEMQQSQLFDIQAHTYSHPNLSPDAYAAYVKKELTSSKEILEKKMGTKVTLLAWPFGIYNSDLEKQAADAGYDMAFTIDARTANKSFRPMAQPRFMIIDGLSEKTFTTIVSEAKNKTPVLSDKSH